MPLPASSTCPPHRRRIWVLTLDERDVDADGVIAAQGTGQEHQLEILTIRRGEAPVQEWTEHAIVTRLDLEGAVERHIGTARRWAAQLRVRWVWLETNAPVVRLQMTARQMRAVGARLRRTLPPARPIRRRSAGSAHDGPGLRHMVSFARATHRLAAAGPPDEVIPVGPGALPAAVAVRTGGAWSRLSGGRDQRGSA